MNVVVASAFRNSAARGQIEPYMARVSALREEIKAFGSVRVVAVEGDSTDDTRNMLARSAKDSHLDLDLVVCEHGGTEFDGSVGKLESRERIAELSKVGNAIFDSVKPFDDVVFYVESDIEWSPSVAVGLIRHALGKVGGFRVFAPMVMTENRFAVASDDDHDNYEIFYDTWGFRGLSGMRFSNFAPYFKGLRADLFEVGSVGSCLAIPAELARKARIEDDYGLVGWCESARRLGAGIAVVPSLSVRHP